MTIFARGLLRLIPQGKPVRYVFGIGKVKINLRPWEMRGRRFTWRSKIHAWLLDCAYPTYPCEDCIGVGCGLELPCYCQYYHAYQPGSGYMPWWVKQLRRFVKPV